MLVHRETNLEEGHPYRATIAIGDGSDEDITDVWARITPSFIPSNELYAHNSVVGLTIVHHASTTNATLLHLTIADVEHSPHNGEEARFAAAKNTIRDMLELLNGIENGNWSEI